MNETPDTGSLTDFFPPGYERVVALAEAWREDPVLRSRLESDPKGFLAERGFELPPELEIRIVANTTETFYVALPPDPNTALDDEALAMVAGGKSASTAGSVGSASTVSSVPSTQSTASSAGSAGSAGSTG